MAERAKRARYAPSARETHLSKAGLEHERVRLRREELWSLYENLKQEADQVATEVLNTRPAEMDAWNEVNQIVTQAMRTAIGSMHTQLLVENRRPNSPQDLLNMCDYRPEQEELDQKLLETVQKLVFENNTATSALLVQEGRLTELASNLYAEESDRLLETLDKAIGFETVVTQPQGLGPRLESADAKLRQLESELLAMRDRIAPIVADSGRVMDFIDAQ